MEFKKRETKEEKKEPSPHNDYSANVAYFNKMIGRVEFVPEIKVEPQKDNKLGNSLCCLFVHGPLFARKGAYWISFHQDHRPFREEMCGILNTMGRKGLLRRTDKPLPTPVDYDDKWGKLFN